MSRTTLTTAFFVICLINATACAQDAKLEVFVQLGHTAAVSSVAFSPDGRYALSGGYDGTLKLWEVSSGREVRTFEGHESGVNSVAFSPDGRYALSGSFDHTLKLWEVSSSREIRTFKGHSDFVQAVAFSPGGRYALSGSDDNTLKLWEVSSGREIRTFEGHHSDLVISVAFSPDGRYALSGSDDKTLKLWEVSSGREVRTFKGHSDWVWSVAFSPDGCTALSGSSDKTLKLWEIVSGREVRTFKGYSDGVTSVAFSPDGRYALSGSRDNTLKLWEVSSGREIRTFKGHSDDVNSVAFSPDGRYALSGSFDHTLKLWEVSSGREIRTFEGHSGLVFSVAFSPDGRYALSGSRDKTLKLWEVSSGREIRTFKGHSNDVNSVAFSHDGRYALSGSKVFYWDKTLNLWEVSSGREIHSFDGRSGPIISVAFSPDGRYALSGSDDKILKLWEVASGREVRTFEGHESGIKSVAFSPDGRYALSGSRDKTLKLWEVATGRFVRTFKGHSHWVSSVAFSPDGRYALSGSLDGAARIWDVNSGEEIVKMVSFTDGEWVSITPEGYYDASPNGAKHINVTVGTNVYSMDNYAETFYRPDLVQLALGGESLAGFATLDDIKPAPEVAFVNTPAKTNQDELEVTIKITDAGGGIGKVRLYLNDVAVLTDGGRGMKAKQTGERRTYRLKLTDGENRLRAIVFNQDNTMESNPAWHTIMADLGKENHNLYALIIGINDYANPTLSLKYAVPDALLFESSLKQAATGLFDRVQISSLTSSPETTRDRIVQTLQSMQKLGPADTFVFYVASHGLVDAGDYYMITSNVGSLSTRKLKETAIIQKDLQDMLINVPAGKKLILFDTCDSGAMGTGLQLAALTRGLSASTAMKLLSRAVGSTVISASSSSQEALEGYEGHGLFTYVLSQGLTGEADTNQDGFVKTRELADYVEDEVTEIAERVFQRTQYPTTTPTGDAFPIGKIDPK